MTPKDYIDYFLFAFASCWGVLQWAAAYSRWRGLLLVKNEIVGYLLGAGALIGAMVWFFSTANRNLPGLEGGQQFLTFGLAAFVALLFTLATSSLTPVGGSETEASGEEGLEALKERTYLKAVRHEQAPRKRLRQRAWRR